MKKIIVAILLAALFLTALCSCADNSGDGEESVTESATQTETNPVDNENNENNENNGNNGDGGENDGDGGNEENNDGENDENKPADGYETDGKWTPYL